MTIERGSLYDELTAVRAGEIDLADTPVEGVPPSTLLWQTVRAVGARATLVG